MRKKILLVVCSIILCASMIGCGATKEKENNSVESKTEESSIETETEENSTESETEVDGTEVYNTILPLPGSIDINNLDNCTVAVSLEQGDAYVDDTGAMQMDVKVYTYDLYDMVDMAALKEGDTIVIREQEVKITSIERNERGLLINGGLDNGGYEFNTDDSTTWYESGYSDAKSYYELGEVTIRVSADLRFYDNSDLDKGEVMYYPGDFLTDKAGIVYHFVPDNTSIVIEDGKIIEMYRRYIP